MAPWWLHDGSMMAPWWLHVNIMSIVLHLTPRKARGTDYFPKETNLEHREEVFGSPAAPHNGGTWWPRGKKAQDV